MSKAGRALWACVLLAPAVVFQSVASQEYYTDCVFNTGESATIVIESIVEPTIFGEELEEGDEIAVFTPEGICGGVAIWKDDGENLALTVWGDNPITPEVDGFAPEEKIGYRIWSKSDNIEAGVPPADVFVGYDSCEDRPPLCIESGEYQGESLSFLMELDVEPFPTRSGSTPDMGALEVQIYPNPVYFVATASIRGLDDFQPLDVTVLDVLGRVVHQNLSLVWGGGMARAYEIAVDDLRPGVYFLSVRTMSRYITEGFTVL
ncbi:MAG: T9SS type A sorting domain-containing protein [Rubricoccaceae bacterium]|nr:T9SS type A sorting domain-containing protein [Rubricoccaceae bacterium]